MEKSNLENLGTDRNIKMELQEVRLGGMDWNDLALDREQVVGLCESSNKPPGTIKCSEYN